MSSEHLSSSVQHISKMVQTNEKDHIYQVDVSFIYREAVNDQLWINFAEHSDLDTVVQKLWEMFIFLRLELYMHSSTNIINDIAMFYDIMKQERCNNSVSTWHSKHSDKHFIQLNQFVLMKE